MSESSGQWSVISGQFKKRLRRVIAQWENKTFNHRGHRGAQGKTGL
jgi:hypothetical protein